MPDGINLDLSASHLSKESLGGRSHGFSYTEQLVSPAMLKLTYETLLDVILTQALNQHEDYVAPYQREFSRLDEGCNSFFTSCNQMIEFLKAVNIAPEMHEDIIA